MCDRAACSREVCAGVCAHVYWRVCAYVVVGVTACVRESVTVCLNVCGRERK